MTRFPSMPARLKLSAIPLLDSLDVIHSNGTELAYIDRIIRVFGPCTDEMLGVNGFARDWKRVAAGLSPVAPHSADLGFPVDLWRADLSRRIATGPKLWEAVEAVAFVAQDDGPRNYGTVVCLDPKRGAVATDGFRISWSRAEIDTKAPICIPKRALKIMLKIGKAFPLEYVDATDDDTCLLFVFGPYRVQVRTSAVRFPNYEGVLPKRERLKEVSPEAFAQALDSVALKLKDARKSESVETTIEGVALNARFLIAIKGKPDFVGVSFGDHEEEPCEIIVGSTHHVVCPVRLAPKEEKKSVSASRVEARA